MRESGAEALKPQSVAFAAALALVACSTPEPAPPAGSASVAAQDTAPFRGTTSPVHKVRTARPRPAPPILRAVHAATHRGYDRVVFEFSSDSVPGYHVEYSDRPARECGSGAEVRLAGAGRLIVRLEPARAHDESGNPTLLDRERAPGLPLLQEMKLVCDFEGQVEWVLGLTVATPYRVQELAAPPRLVVDLRHRE